MKTPVVFLVFNRPDLTAQVFSRIRDARPDKLLIVCDGVRSDQPNDIDKVRAVRALIESGVDWPCEVLRNYAETNMGCRMRVSSGLTWAFSQVPEAIVLEDDCFPDPSFFSFCATMLDHYRDDTRIMHIAGTNLSAPYQKRSTSYWFSHHTPIWGWATWSRAWRFYDLPMQSWDQRNVELRASFASQWELHYWYPLLERARHKIAEVNTWDFSWTFTCRSLQGLSVIPRNNLVANLGIGPDSTHTSAINTRLTPPVCPLSDLDHPESILWDRYSDDFLTRVYSGERTDVIGKIRATLSVWRNTTGGRQAI